MSSRLLYKRRVSLAGMAIVLLMLWGMRASVAQGPEPPGLEVALSADPQADLSDAGMVGEQFVYQGMLRQNGRPANGWFGMAFRLYSDSACTLLVSGDLPIVYATATDDLADPESAPPVKGQGGPGDGAMVTDGLFSVTLGVPQTYFDGQALWLRVEVEGTQIGCQEILPVPYALGLRPGARINGNVASPSAALNVGSSGTGFGIYGYGRDVAIYGHGSSGTGVKAYGAYYGLYGLSSSVGVYGEGNLLHGVMGISHGEYPGAAGVSGEGIDGTTGVHGRSDSGPAILAISSSGDLIRAAQEWSPFRETDWKFRVTNQGNVQADGSYTSPAADMAEMLPAAEGLEPGDVLAVDGNGVLVRSTTPYQSTVVGVYSTRPGFVGGAKEDADRTGQAPLAVVGVVPVKVSAENGAIAPGDLLVASSLPGYAMKAEANPPVGTVIGKALEGSTLETDILQMLIMLR